MDFGDGLICGAGWAGAWRGMVHSAARLTIEKVIKEKDPGVHGLHLEDPEVGTETV